MKRRIIFGSIAICTVIAISQTRGLATGVETPRNFTEISKEEKAAWGKSIFIKDCLACHTIEEKNKYGPHVAGLLGRTVGDASGFKYSDAFKQLNAKGVTWTDDNLRRFLKDPQGFAPGSQMWVNIPDDEVIEVLVEYFKSTSAK